MGLLMALGSSICRVLGNYFTSQLELVAVKVYDCAALQQLLGIGRDRAYRILRGYGFRVGDRALRISGPQLQEYIREREKNGRTR